MRFEQEFRKARPETVGETDREFDLSNYVEWLESLVEEKLTAHNTARDETVRVWKGSCADCLHRDVMERDENEPCFSCHPNNHSNFLPRTASPVA